MHRPSIVFVLWLLISVDLDLKAYVKIFQNQFIFPSSDLSPTILPDLEVLGVLTKRTNKNFISVRSMNLIPETKSGIKIGNQA